MKPSHPHDCDTCIFLGSMKSLYEDEAALVDLYFHEGGLGAECTFIARYGEDGDYSSGQEFCWSNPHLNHALRLAHGKGILKDKVLEELRWHQGKWLSYYAMDLDYKRSVDERFKEERFILE